jgi:hypothetical protein
MGNFELVGLAVTLYNRIEELLGSTLGRATGCPD